MEKNRWRPNLPDNASGVSVQVEEVEEECDEERTNNGNIQLDRYVYILQTNVIKAENL